MKFSSYRRPCFFFRPPEEFQLPTNIHHLQVQYNILRSKEPEVSQPLSHNIGSLNTINIINSTVTDERAKILAWPSPLDPKLRHKDTQDRRVENVGGWLSQTEKLRSWYTGSEGGESDKAYLV